MAIKMKLTTVSSFTSHSSMQCYTKSLNTFIRKLNI